MKKTVNSSDFVDAFRGHDLMDQFSYEGLRALFEYLEELEELESGTSEEMELDVIAICCEFNEYATATEAAAEHGWEADAEADEDDNEEAALEWLQGQTTVIPHEKGIIVQSF